MSNTNTATGAAAQPGTAVQRIVPILIATVATVVVWLLAQSAFGVDLKAKQNGDVSEIKLPAVVIATLVIGLVAWGLLAILERSSTSPKKIWTIIAGVVLVLSLLGPLGAEGTGSKVSLLLIHLVAAAVLIPGLSRNAASRKA